MVTVVVHVRQYVCRLSMPTFSKHLLTHPEGIWHLLLLHLGLSCGFINTSLAMDLQCDANTPHGLTANRLVVGEISPFTVGPNPQFQICAFLASASASVLSCRTTVRALLAPVSRVPTSPSVAANFQMSIFFVTLKNLCHLIGYLS